MDSRYRSPIYRAAPILSPCVTPPAKLLQEAHVPTMINADRRSFLRTGAIAGALLAAAPSGAFAEDSNDDRLRKGDADIGFREGLRYFLGLIRDTIDRGA